MFTITGRYTHNLTPNPRPDCGELLFNTYKAPRPDREAVPSYRSAAPIRPPHPRSREGSGRRRLPPASSASLTGTVLHGTMRRERDTSAPGALHLPSYRVAAIAVARCCTSQHSYNRDLATALRRAFPKNPDHPRVAFPPPPYGVPSAAAGDPRAVECRNLKNRPETPTTSACMTAGHATCRPRAA